jgi:hypothetical protein
MEADYGDDEDDSTECQQTPSGQIGRPPAIVRGRVSKYGKNGSKRAVMDVICFLCISRGSSTVKLHDSLGSRRACACSEAGFGSQNGDLA